MPEKIITYSFGENFIEKLSDHIEAEFLSKDLDLSRVAIVFGGKRPGLFLKRQLSKKIKKAFYPPRFFSIDEFVEYLVSKKTPLNWIQDLDACYRIYKLAKKEIPQVLQARESFSCFIAWAREILAFIDQMDLEDISDADLKNVQDNAQIGYDVPESINELMSHIVLIRGQYHKLLKQDNIFSKGSLYLYAAKHIEDIDTAEFDKILFCNFFDLRRSQKKIIKHFLDTDKAKIFFQSGEKVWTQLENLGEYFGCPIKPVNIIKPDYELNLYAGFDMHSQVGIVRELIKKIRDLEDLDKTVIVLPNTDAVVPLLSEISNYASEFNVSCGYPVQRSSLYTLFSYIINSQQTKKGSAFYTKDYLKVLKHPFIKNLKFKHDAQLTRILVHKLEDILTGTEENELGGSLFVKLPEIENLRLLYYLVKEQRQSADYNVTENDIKKTLEQLHKYAFKIWQDIKTFSDFARALDEFISILIDKSFLDVYALNLKIVERLYAIRDEFAQVSFSEDEFSTYDIFRIFEDRLQTEKVSFTGVPLKGLQVLGLFETRSLDFENVIIIDVNESVLPKLKIHEPLIPRQVMINLGFDQLEVEDAIQRYHFTRLISSAKKVSLIYDDSPQKQRSRFIEELIWNKEFQKGSLNILAITRASFNLNVLPTTVSIEKTKDVLNLLKKFTFSPTSINNYINCPLKFYYQNILCLKEQEDLLEEPQSRQIGNFVHKLLENAYKPFMNSGLKIDEKFKIFFFKEFNKKFDAEFSQRMKSDSFMLKYIMKYRLEKFLENEAERASEIKEIIGLEHDLIDYIELSSRKIPFKCRIDRVEKLQDSSILVIDYKTGSIDTIPKNISKLDTLETLDRESIQKSIQSFQLPIYTYFMQKQYPKAQIKSCLYSLKTQELNYFPKAKEQDNLDSIMSTCLKALSFVIDEINNPEIPFETSTDPAKSCQYCEFGGMCR